MTAKTTFEGRDIATAVAKAARAQGVSPDELQYDVLAGRGGGFALIKVRTGEAAAPVGGEKLSGGLVTGNARPAPTADAPAEDRGAPDRGDRGAPDRGDRDRGDRGAPDRGDRDRGDRGDRDRGDRDRGDRDRGGRGRGRSERGGRGGRDRDRGGRGGRDRDRGDRGRPPRRERTPISVPQDGPTEVTMVVIDDMELGEIGEDAHEVLRDILTGMGFGMTVKVQEDETSIRFDLESGVYHDALVANDLELLDAVQYLVDRIVNFDADERKRIQLDSNGHKLKLDEDLGQTARELAERAQEEGQTVKVGPLDPRSRRIVHMALREVTGVTTQSEGEGVFRRVCIIPKGS